MRNVVTTDLHIEGIERIELIESEHFDSKVVLFLGCSTLFLKEKEISVKVGDSKVKVSTLEFMQAFKDMLDTGVFEMDQINSVAWQVENLLVEARESRDKALETLMEIRGV